MGDADRSPLIADHPAYGWALARVLATSGLPRRAVLEPAIVGMGIVPDLSAEGLAHFLEHSAAIAVAHWPQLRATGAQKRRAARILRRMRRGAQRG